jgi:large subunit ribosomal protein L14
MIQKSSILVPADKCGVFTVNAFHLYKGFSRKFSKFGDYIKVSIRKTKPDNILSKKSKRKAIIIRTKKKIIVCDGTQVRFDYNSVIILKKRLTPEGKEIFGPIVRNFKKKKFLSSFSGLI